MRSFKSVFGVARAGLPVLYCGYLLYYFLDVSGSVQEARDIGLGPTLLGLGIVGLLFCIPLAVKIVRLFIGPRSPGSSAPGPGSSGSGLTDSCGRGPDAPSSDGESGIDADAVVARYLARRSAEAAAASPAAPRAQEGRRPASPSFGRRVR